MIQELYKRYRPKTFDDVIGQDHVIKPLKKMVEQNKVPHAILLCGPKGCGKCVTGNTLIPTNKGLVRIDSFDAPNTKDGFSDKNILILSTKGVTNTTKFFKEKTNTTYEIVNELGISIRGTPEHPILVLDKKTLDYRFKQLKDITTNDYACISRNSMLFADDDVQIDFCYSPNAHDSGSIPLDNIPDKMTASLARLLGYIVANGNSYDGIINISTCNEEIQKDISTIVKTFGHKISKIQAGKDFNIGGKQLCSFIFYLFDCEDKLPTARFKYIPWSILKSTKNIQIEFLKAIFDCDSWWRKNYVLEYSTASERLAIEVQQMLLTFGIISRLHPFYNKKYKHTYWGVTITGKDFDRFFALTGPTIKYKSYESIKRNTNRDIIPYLKLYLNKEILKLKSRLQVKKNGVFVLEGINCRFSLGCALPYQNNTLHPSEATYSWIENFIGLCKKMPSMPEVRKMMGTCHKFLNSGYYFSKIVETKKIKEPVMVYDFTIPKSHSFVSNGYISHNTTIGRILKKELKCSKWDFIEQNCANKRGIDSIREIERTMNLAPMKGKSKIWLFDEAHQWTGESQDALLKILEDTPKHVYFIICTTDPQKLKDTIRSRPTEFAVKPLAAKTLQTLINRICKTENKKLPEEVIEKIIDNADGSARNALVLLDKVLILDDEDEQLDTISKASNEAAAIQIARTLFNPKATWAEMAKILKQTEAEEPESMRWMILGYARSILLGGGKLSERADRVICVFRDNFYDCKNAGLASCCYEIITGK